MLLLSSTYLGNIQWMSKLLAGKAVIDVGQHFVKQSWRNRCEILSAGGATSGGGNGVRESLTVHVAAGAQRLAMRDVRIDESKRWRHRHIQALRSAYGRAPFFEHYWGDFERVLSGRQKFLWELNHELLTTMLRLLKSDVTPTYSESYIDIYDYQRAQPITCQSVILSKAKDLKANRYEKVPWCPGRHAQDDATQALDMGADCCLKQKGDDFRDSISPKARLARPDETFNPQPYWQVFCDGDFVPNLSTADVLMCEGFAALDIIKASCNIRTFCNKT